MAELVDWHRDLLVRMRERRQERTGRARYGIRPPRRERTAIVTDSSAALPPVVFEHPMVTALRVVPMPVMIGEQIHTEGTGELEAELPLALAAGTPVRTSRPSPGLFRRVYAEVADAGFGRIVSIHLSGQLSGTVEAARLAARETSVPVTVVDSQTTGFALGTVVLDALITAGFGERQQSIAEAAARASTASQVAFTVPNLEQLRRGGRIGTMAGLVGSLLQVKPVLALQEGVISLKDRPRTAARAMDRLVELITQDSDAERDRLAVHCFGNLQAGEALAQRLQDVSSTPIPVITLPAVLAAHLGLGVLGVTINPLRPPEPVESGETTEPTIDAG